MYSRSSLRPQRTQEPAIPRGSSMTANIPSFGYGIPGHYPAPKSSHDGVRPSHTMPLSMEESDPTELRQSYSGNLLFRRKRSNDKEQQSRSRAEDLCKRLELAESRDLELRKAPSFERSGSKQAPSLGGNMMSLSQASALVVQNKQKSLERAEHDPLLTDRERLDNAISALRLDATHSADPTSSTLSFDSSAFQTEVTMATSRSVEENDVNPGSTLSHISAKKTRDHTILGELQHDAGNKPTQRVPLTENKIPCCDSEPPKKMTQAEKRAELARQTRQRLATAAASKSRIPELC